MKPALDLILSAPDCRLYEAETPGSPTRSYIVSTAETRAICNDPLVFGLRYTRTLSTACVRALRALRDAGVISPAEHNTVVVHVLRGGLNFGLREALGEAFGWNDHASGFLSAQRTQNPHDPAAWSIIEDAYRKVALRSDTDVIFGDVVATGTSLEHTLRLLEASSSDGAGIRSLLFFTIGGPRSAELIGEFHRRYQARFPSLKRSTVVYFEGAFTVPDAATPLRIKEIGTDLVRHGALMAPEFIDSQREHPAYPIERCAIYDAGCRSFDPENYLHEVQSYWEKVQKLAEQGVSYSDLRSERMPLLQSPGSFAPSLLELAEIQLNRIRRIGSPKSRAGISIERTATDRISPADLAQTTPAEKRRKGAPIR